MITIQDNIRTGKVCSRHDVADLLPIANKPIGQLCEENEHLLVFPGKFSIEVQKSEGFQA